MYILNEICYWTTSIGVIYFLYNSVNVLREDWKQSICQGHCVYFTTVVVTIHIITSGLCLIREKLNDMFIEESHGSPALLKMPIYSTELVAVIFV